MAVLANMTEVAIKDFLNDEDIFITGCTGLTGKALVEKIIRSCAGVSKVFLMIRSSKDKTCEERLEILKASRIFDRVREEDPKALGKLIAVEGDLGKIGLGLSESSIKMMENVTVVYHVAATVRFDEPLKNAIIFNIRGTREVCIFGTKLKKLKVFVHVSTIYSNPYLSYVEERVYPEKMSWKHVVKLAETMDYDSLNALCNKIMGEFPNTYTFTKHLAEAVVNEFQDQMKVAIVRPSIIHSAGSEPYEGWYDNYNGIMGLITGTYTGVVRGFYCDPQLVVDLIPLDDTVKLIIICGWWQLNFEEPKKDTASVYNLAASAIRSYSIETMVRFSDEIIQEFAFNKCLWYPNFGLTKNIYYFYYRIYLYHVLPAIFLDLLLRLFKEKPFMMKLQRRSLASQNAVRFFSFNEYKFQASRLWTMMEILKNHPEFRVDRLINKTAHDVTLISLLGARRYLLNEDDSTIPAARKRLQIMKYASRTIKGLFTTWIVYKLFNTLAYSYL